MTIINSYYINNSDSALHKNMLGSLISKAWKESFAIVICCEKDMIETIDQWIWTYEQLSFIPHITELDCDAAPSLIKSNNVFIISKDNEKYSDIILHKNKKILINLSSKLHDKDYIEKYDKYLYFFFDKGSTLLLNKVAHYVKSIAMQHNIYKYCDKMQKWEV